MKSYTQIADKYLIQNKRRSLVSIIAVILATMFISGIGHMMYSSQQNIISMLRETGDYHVKFTLKQKSDFNSLKVHSSVDKATFCQKVGCTELDKKSLVINEITKDGFSMLGINLKEGRLPKKNNEIILNLDFKEQKKIGDKISAILYDGKTVDYTIVGFSDLMNKPFAKMYDAYSVGKKLTLDNADVYVKLKEIGKLNNKIDGLARDFKIDSKNVVKNEALLTALGQGRNKSAIADYIIFIMVAIVVAFVTIVFIYNSFNIAIVERKKEYGLIKAIGGTSKHIKEIIYKEAFIITIIALPIGLLLGMAAGTILFGAFNGLILKKAITIKTYISLYSILATSIITIITVYLSATFVLKKIKKVSPLDCFSNRGYEVNKVNTIRGKLFDKLFYIEGIIANRNIRINKERFRTTVASIAFSIVVFITFSSLVCNIDQLPYEALPIDKNISRYNHTFFLNYGENTSKDLINKNSKQISTIIDKVKNISEIKNIYRLYLSTKSYAFIPEKRSVIKGANANIDGKRYSTLKSEIYPIDLNTIDQLSPYLLSGTTNKKKLNKEKGVYITQIGYDQNLKKAGNDKWEKKDITTLKVGDEILIDTSNLMYNNSFLNNKNTAKGVVKVKVLGIVNVILFNKENFSEMNPIIYMPTGLYNEIIEKKYTNKPNNYKDNEAKKQEIDRLQPAKLIGFSVSYKDYVSSNDRANIGTEIGEIFNKYYDKGEAGVDMIFDESCNKLIKFGKLFYFSVIAFIAIISMANVFNVVNTNVILRSNELALLAVVGASSKSIKKIIYLEGMLFSVIGIIYGVIIGGLNSVIISKIFITGHDIAYVYPLKETLISIGFFIAVGIIAIYFPLKKIKKENLLQYKEY